MARFATAFLAIFALDAALTLIDGVADLALGAHPLRGVAGVLTLVLALWSCAVVVACGFDRRLPKRVLLPVATFVVWVSLGAMPLTILWGADSVGLTLGAFQASLAAAVYRWLLAQTGRLAITERWLETREPSFLWMYFLGYVGATGVGVPVVLGAYLISSLAITLDHYSAGYMTLRPDGVYSLERVFERGGQRAYLIGMVHVGASEFYDSVLSGIPTERSVVLLEGVGDADERVDNFHYGQVADFLGLDEQANSFELSEEHEVLSADVDMADFADSTVEFLRAIGAVLQADSRAERLIALEAYFETAQDPATVARVWEDILTLRNTRLLENFDALGPERAHIIVPWGALHMRALDPALRERGFVPVEERQRRAIGWSAD